MPAIGDPTSLAASVKALAREVRDSALENDLRFDAIRRTAVQGVEALEDRTAEFTNDIIFRVARMEREIRKLKSQAQQSVALAPPSRESTPPDSRKPDCSETSPIHISAFIVRWWRFLRRIRF